MFVYTLLADGFEECEALVPADLLLRAGAEVFLVSVSENLSVTGAHGIAVRADITITAAEKEKMGCLILPGGKNGVANLNKNPKTAEFINHAVAKGVYIGAICAAPSILGDMGLLDGRRAVCHPSFTQHLSRSVLTGKKVEHDDIFITAEGMGVSFEFGYKLTELLFGSETLKKIKNSICAG